MTPGSIVQCRNREWVLLPSDRDDALLLHPLTGATDETVAVHKKLTDLIGYSFPEERVRSAKFPPPTTNDISNAAGAHLLWQAARLTLREGATPLRFWGRISIRPPTYQFVPLLMVFHPQPGIPRRSAIAISLARGAAGLAGGGIGRLVCPRLQANARRVALHPRPGGRPRPGLPRRNIPRAEGKGDRPIWLVPHQKTCFGSVGKTARESDVN
jgi:hypothetical protein